MSGPTRQRSLRERIQSASRGIGISWQGKKSKSYHSKESLSEAQSSESEAEARNKDEIESGGADNRTKEQDTTEKSAEPVANKDEGVSLEKKPLGRSLTQPQGTEQYQVEPSDTLAGIAARFDTTPSELAKLNRLSARIVFPGQLLFVPEKKNRNSEPQESEDATDTLAPPQNEKDRRPSVTDALRIPYRRASEKAHRFLKVKARHFTDGQGVVAGVLIITPNAVMFDPNVSDPLVIEHGVESYGVIAPLDMLMRAAIYFDIAHMKVQHAAPQDQGPRPKADVYYGKMADESADDKSRQCPPLEVNPPCIKVGTPSSASQDELPTPHLETTTAEPSPDSNKTTEAEPPPAQQPETTTTTEVQEASESQSATTATVHTTTPSSQSEPLDNVEHSPAQMPISTDSVDSLDAEVSDAFAAAENQAQDTPAESRRERMLKRLSYPMESITSISRILTSSPKSFVDFSGSLFSSKGSTDEEAVKEEIREEQDQPPPPTTPGASAQQQSEQQQQQPLNKDQQQKEQQQQFGYQNFVEEKPEIFATMDRLLKDRKLGAEEGQPLYLCLRMGMPKEPKPQPLTVLSYGKKRARSEYWFSIPHSRVDDLYNFLQQWISHLYGEVDDVDPEESGFIPIDDSAPDEEEEEEVEKERGDDEGEEGEGEKKEPPRSFLQLVEETLGFKSISQADWEVLSLDEMEGIDYTMELPVPELEDKSEIIDTEHITALYKLVPPRAYSHSWKRIYSTNEDGFNLRTLYRKNCEYDCPVFIFVKNTKDEVFGAFLSVPLRQSDSFYGTGESFLFTFHPTFKEFKWTGQNDYFIKGNTDSISFGASEGHFGLWLDADLYRGSSVRCQTYDNDPLASSDDFIVKILEAWVFT